MNRVLLLVSIAAVTLFGCQAPAPTPTITAVPTIIPTIPPPTATEIPPTNIPLSTPTATTAAAPTTTPTPEPPPAVALDLLLGTWTQFDTQAQGNNFIIFRPDGSFRARHGPNVENSTVVSNGTFNLQGDELTITDNKDCPNGERYRIKFTTQTHLFFTVLDSTCNNFADDFRRQPNWDRVPNAP